MIRLAAASCLLACALAATAAEQRIALVVGNNAYEGAPLRNPVNDATAIAAKLRAAGFEVTLRKDVAQRELTRAISQFGRAMKPGAVALFYYAGHGMQVRGRNFLIPVDADIQSEAAARSEGVDVDLVLEQLAPARLSMVILDACRNNPFEGRMRGARGSGLAQIDAPKGTLVAYATAPGRVAADGDGANGVYTAELLKAMEVPGLKVEELFKRVRVNVTRVTANQQIPWESSSLTGDFYFAPDDKPPAAHNEALKAVADERRRREVESRLLKEEMDKLREEIRALRGTPRPAPSQAPTVAAKAAPAAEPVIVAKVDTKPVSPARPVAAKRRDSLELLRAERGKLSFAKAMAILLAVDDEGDLGRLLEGERALKRLPYHNAVAMGVNDKGRISWGRSGRLDVGNFAEAQAVEICRRFAASCRVVVFDGELREEGFLQLAAEFGNRDPKAARATMLKKLPHD